MSSLHFKPAYPQHFDAARECWVSRPDHNQALSYPETILEALRRKIPQLHLSEIALEAGKNIGSGRFWVRVTGGYEADASRTAFVRALGIPGKSIHHSFVENREGKPHSPDVYLTLPEQETCRSLGIAPQQRA